MSERFDKSASIRTKGAAILLMLTHHLFAFPKWILPGNEFSGGVLIQGRPLAAYIGEFGKICVAIYALLTGIAMYYIYRGGALKDGYGRTLKRLPRFYAGYWAALLLLAPILAAAGSVSFDAQEILLNLAGVKVSYCSFAWYVRFYVATVLLFPAWIWLYDALRRKLRLEASPAGVLLLALGLAFRLMNRTHVPGKICFLEYLYYTPLVLTGYAVARERWDERIAAQLRRLPAAARIAACAGVLALCVLLRSRADRLASFNLDVLYAPAAVCALWQLLDTLRWRSLDAALAFLGRNSVEMWYLHAAFFTGSAAIQRVAYWPKHPALILLWTTALLLPFAMATRWAVNEGFRILRKIRKKPFRE